MTRIAPACWKGRCIGSTWRKSFARKNRSRNCWGPNFVGLTTSGEAAYSARVATRSSYASSIHAVGMHKKIRFSSGIDAHPQTRYVLRPCQTALANNPCVDVLGQTRARGRVPAAIPQVRQVNNTRALGLALSYDDSDPAVTRAR